MKKGDKVWVVQLDDTGCYCVMTAVIQEKNESHRGTGYYVKMRRRDREGTLHTMVVDRPANRLFDSEKKALLSAAEFNAKSADKHTAMRWSQIQKAEKLK